MVCITRVHLQSQLTCEQTCTNDTIIWVVASSQKVGIWYTQNVTVGIISTFWYRPYMYNVFAGRLRERCRVEITHVCLIDKSTITLGMHEWFATLQPFPNLSAKTCTTWCFWDPKQGFLIPFEATIIIRPSCSREAIISHTLLQPFIIS